MLTPKNGTGEGLTSGSSLVTKYHSASKIFSEDSVKGACGRRCAIIRQRDCLRFTRNFRECVVTWPDIRKERVDGVYEMAISVGALI
jgi:hypothetical protein